MTATRTTYAVALALAAVFAFAGDSHAQSFRLGVRLFPAAGGGMKISEVVDNSPAMEYGLVGGNTILTVNGRFVTSGEAIRDELAARDTATMVIINGGRFEELSIPLVSNQAYAARAKGEVGSPGKFGAAPPAKSKVTRRVVADPRK